MEKNVQENVDYTFLYRHEVSKLLDQLVTNKKNYRKRDNIIKKIFGMERHAVPVILDRLKDAETKEASILSQLLMLLEVDDENIGEKLISLAFDSKIPDKNKNYILKVLDYYGLEPAELPHEEVFSDPEKALKDARESLFTEITQNLEAIPQFLMEISDFSPEVQSTLVQEMAKTGDEKAVTLLKVLAQLDEYEIANEAIKGLGDNATPLAYSALEELLDKEDREEFYPLINEEIKKLKSKGVKASNEKEIEGFKTGEIYQAAVSKLDGRGNRAIWLALRWGEDKGGICLINFLSNINEGLNDCWGIYRITISEFKKIMADFRRDNSLISNDPEYAKALLKNAISKTTETGSNKPMEFSFWRNFLSEDWTSPEPYNPEFDKYSKIFESGESNNKLWKELKKLHEYKDFWDWFVHHPYVYDLASDMLYKSKKSKKLIVLSTSADQEEIYQKFVDNLIKPRLDFYIKALRLMADFELRKGRTKMYRVIMLALYYLEEKKEVENHPFIQGIVNKSLQMAAQNLKHGYDLRINPEEFDY
ncbi:HEAT repeat domain-containing protein [Natranaerofaba carboxydovora]|uniref:HEAT repeat domain-containing protein n=1 Tax=Natranaerofaba carboxydovora TaxID=2742683 RepID=UPI001F1467F4|nr:HEAT repeat domain-containing protein [Natranaerofaba carboxydovora]UMZ75065.1 HEAT repeat-containing protein [Natranaerofaba carboxydovora]